MFFKGHKKKVYPAKTWRQISLVIQLALIFSLTLSTFVPIEANGFWRPPCDYLITLDLSPTPTDFTNLDFDNAADVAKFALAGRGYGLNGQMLEDFFGRIARGEQDGRKVFNRLAFDASARPVVQLTDAVYTPTMWEKVQAIVFPKTRKQVRAQKAFLREDLISGFESLGVLGHITTGQLVRKGIRKTLGSTGRVLGLVLQGAILHFAHASLELQVGLPLVTLVGATVDPAYLIDHLPPWILHKQIEQGTDAIKDDILNYFQFRENASYAWNLIRQSLLVGSLGTVLWMARGMPIATTILETLMTAQADRYYKKFNHDHLQEKRDAAFESWRYSYSLDHEDPVTHKPYWPDPTCKNPKFPDEQHACEINRYTAYGTTEKQFLGPSFDKISPSNSKSK